jgi:hypothetical protein
MGRDRGHPALREGHRLLFRSHFMLGSPPGSIMLARVGMKRGHSKRFRRYVFLPSNISLGCHCIFLPRCVAYDNMTASIDPSSRTILGPLTTTFSAPATCTVGQRACSTCNYAWQAQTCYSAGAGGSETYGVKDATQCWPPTSSGLPEPTPPLWGWGFYSPGLICPTGYTSACSATAGSALTWTPEWSLAAGETAVGCCPRCVQDSKLSQIWKHTSKI